MSGATAAATTKAFSRRLSATGDAQASTHPAKKCVTGLIELYKPTIKTARCGLTRGRAVNFHRISASTIGDPMSEQHPLVTSGRSQKFQSIRLRDSCPQNTFVLR